MGITVGKHKNQGDMLTCSICMHVFRVPRMLPCQHTFCETCLQTYISTIGVREESKLDFQCPICRETVRVPNSSKPREKWSKLFPKNRLILSLLDNQPQRAETCRQHPDRQVEFYCDSHKQIGCSSCLLTMHKSCDICSIDEHVKGDKFKKNCNLINDHLLQYRKLFENMVVGVNKNVDGLEQERVRLLESVKETRRQIDTILDKLETQFTASLADYHIRETEALFEKTGRCRKVIAEINNTREQLKTAQLSSHQVQKAEVMIAVEEKLNTINILSKDEYTTFEHISFDMTMNSTVDTFLNTLGEIATVKVNKTKPNLSLPSFVPKSLFQKAAPMKKHKNQLVTKVGEFHIGGENDSFYCNITSTVVLPDGRIIMADDSNCKLKLMDGRFALQSEMKLDSNPLNLATVSDTEIAVSLPGKREVLFAGVGEDQLLTVKRTFPTSLDCWGIEVVAETVIITTGRDGHSVMLLDMQGKELHTFLLTSYVDENIRCPVAVEADKVKKLLYVTCTGGAWSKGCVVVMDMEGNLLHTFYDPDLDTPRSCSLDRHGKIYICGLESSTVYNVTRGGDMFRIFPSRKEEVIGPLHMNFIKNYHVRFLLTEVASDKVKVYELPSA